MHDPGVATISIALTTGLLRPFAEHFAQIEVLPQQLPRLRDRHVRSQRALAATCTTYSTLPLFASSSST